MSSDKKSLKSFEELRKEFLSSFSSNDYLDTPSSLDIKDSLEPKVSKTISDTLVADSLYTEPYTIKVIDFGKSHHVKNQSFTNMIRNKDQSSLLNEKILNILSLHDTKFNEDTFPLIYDGEVQFSGQKSSKRIVKIFGYTDNRLNPTQKWIYKGPVTQHLNFKISNDMLRVLTQTDIIKNEMNIIIIDPHHLCVTANPDTYKVVKNFNVCISSMFPKLLK